MVSLTLGVIIIKCPGDVYWMEKGDSVGAKCTELMIDIYGATVKLFFCYRQTHLYRTNGHSLNEITNEASQ